MVQAKEVHRGGASPPAATEASPALALIAAVEAQEARAKARDFVPENGGCPGMQEEGVQAHVQAQEQGKGLAERTDQRNVAQNAEGDADKGGDRGEGTVDGKVEGEGEGDGGMGEEAAGEGRGCEEVEERVKRAQEGKRVGGGGGGESRKRVPELRVRDGHVSVAKCYDIKDALRVRGFRWDAANRCAHFTCMDKNIYIRVHIHAYMHTCIHTCMHACIHTFIIACVSTYTCMPACLRVCL